MGALATIQEGNKCSEKTKAKAVVFLHQHINEMVEFEYSNWDDPSSLWKDLEIRFNNQREVLLSSARDEWNNLCRPTGSLALPEANAVNNNDNKNSGSKRRRGNPRGSGRGHYGHNHFPNRNYTYHRGGYNSRGRGRGQRNNSYHAPQVNNINQKSNEVGTSQNAKGSCFRCGNENHWSKSCRTPSHLCELYQASHKGKEKEVNHVDQFDNTNTELIASDFFNDLEV
ncbi:retrovirus-related pol polyprotein from transposon TNT 1-94 [Tanacetum coccineum]